MLVIPYIIMISISSSQSTTYTTEEENSLRSTFHEVIRDSNDNNGNILETSDVPISSAQPTKTPDVPLKGRRKCLNPTSLRGQGQTGQRRQKNNIKAIDRISHGSIKRLARRAGVRRISGDMYCEAKIALQIFVKKVLRDAVIYTEHGKRRTVTELDIKYALKRQGITFY